MARVRRAKLRKTDVSDETTQNLTTSAQSGDIGASKLRRVATLIAAERLSPSVRGLRFSTVQPLAYQAGQWVNLYVKTSAGEEMRAYSIASPPDPARPTEFEIAVTRVEGGLASQALHDMAAGESVIFDGPWGFFTHDDRADATVFVGTGTGLSPLRAMLHAELARAGSAPMVLLFGCRSEEDILYRKELEALASNHPRFRYEVTLSRPSSEWRGRSGYVQTHLPELVTPLAPAHVYICGLSKMVKEVRRVLKEDLGLDRKAIHSERYD